MRRAGTAKTSPGQRSHTKGAEAQKEKETQDTSQLKGMGAKYMF